MIYNTIIGASRTETYTAYRQVYKCIGVVNPDNPHRMGSTMEIMPLPSGGCDPIYDDNCRENENCRWVTESYTATRRINEGSDGLFPLSTQRMNGMANDDVYTAEGVNHLEVGNHSEMTRILNDIFDSEVGSPFRRRER